jgi:predicted DNA-binding transcriptional regulator AlpA
MSVTKQPEAAPSPELLTLAMVRERYVPLGARTLFRMIAAGTFPKADISIGAKTRLWKRSTVESWIEKNGEDQR